MSSGLLPRPRLLVGSVLAHDGFTLDKLLEGVVGFLYVSQKVK